jgi:hypothetical protein
MPAHDPLARHANARVAALKRHRPADDPAIMEATRDLRAARLEEHIRRVVDTAPVLSTAQRDRLSVLLRPAASGGDAP